MASVIPIVIGIVLVLTLVFVGRTVFGALGYDPGAPDYSLNGTTLAVNDRFYPVTIGAASVDVAGVRVVDLDQETGWRPTLRVGGFGNSHYQSGWFRAANGTRMRLYRARKVQRLVLLPAKGEGAPVLLQVADPERFVEQIRVGWSAG